MRTAKINTILKYPVNKLFADENTYHDTNQIDSLPLPLLSCKSWILVKEKPDRKKENSALQDLSTDFRSMMAEECLNDTNREKLALYGIQYKNSFKYKVGCFWRFSYVYKIN